MPLSVFGETKDVQPLFESGAVGIQRSRAVRFSSKILSPGMYIDNRKLQSHPREWNEILARLRRYAERSLVDYKAIASIESGGVPHGVALARTIGAPHFTVKKEEKKGHGLGGLIGGDAGELKGKSVLLVEDMSSTFESSLKAMKTLKAAGATVAHTIMLNTWGFPEFHKNIVGHSVHALCTGEMIVNYAASRSMIDREHEKIVRHWLEHPEDEEWSKDGWELPEQASG